MFVCTFNSIINTLMKKCEIEEEEEKKKKKKKKKRRRRRE